MLAKRTLHPALSFWNHTPDNAPQTPPDTSDSDTDDDVSMDSSQPPSRPISVSIPGGHHPPRPTLDEVLANTATPPYTLSAFMAYLSQNHCLETLEFTLDANRYRDTYNAACRNLHESPLVSKGPENDHLRMLWERLISAYVVPGAVREVNLTSQVRDALLSCRYSSVPPPPQTLDSAVKRIHDLMDESIFLPFLNAFSSSTSLQHSLSTSPHDELDESLAMSNSSLDEPSTGRHPSRRRRASPQQSRADFSSYRQQALGYSSRSGNTGKTSQGHRTSGHGSTMSENSGSVSLTDDSGSGVSSPELGEPMTPPTTPPSTDMYPHHPGQSPKPRSDNAWRKMGMKLGWKKKSGGGSGSSQTSSSGSKNPSIEDD